MKTAEVAYAEGKTEAEKREAALAAAKAIVERDGKTAVVVERVVAGRSRGVAALSAYDDLPVGHHVRYWVSVTGLVRKASEWCS